MDHYSSWRLTRIEGSSPEGCMIYCRWLLADPGFRCEYFLHFAKEGRGEYCDFYRRDPSDPRFHRPRAEPEVTTGFPLQCRRMRI